MAKTPASGAPSRDPLKTVADALDTAVKAAKDRTADAKASAERAFPGAGRFLSRFVYTTSYIFSYGVVFPAVLIARSVPEDNPVVQGFVDGARDASVRVDEWKHRQLEPPAEPPPSPPSEPSSSPPRSSQGKRKTAK